MFLKLFYKVLAWLYDLLDVIYFRDPQKSPRARVLEAVEEADEILDLCTGTAANAIKIARAKPDTFIVGIDTSRDMLRIAERKLKRKNIRNITLRQMDATRTEFADGQFDKVLLSLILHELDEETAARMLAEAKRVLKDDGQIIVMEWELRPTLWGRLMFIPLHIVETNTFRRFLKKDLPAYFHHHGLQTVQQHHCDHSTVLLLQKSPHRSAP